MLLLHLQVLKTGKQLQFTFLLTQGEYHTSVSNLDETIQKFNLNMNLKLSGEN